jgi:hypothetical protein
VRFKITVEDVYGCSHRFPSEFTVEMVDAILRVKLKNIPARSDIILGNYELSNSKNSKQILRRSSPLQLDAGTRLIMAMIIEPV